MKYEVEEKLMNDILQYLGSQPYVKVASLIQGIQTGLKPITKDLDKDIKKAEEELKKEDIKKAVKDVEEGKKNE